MNIRERDYFKIIRNTYEISHNYSENFYTDLSEAKNTISQLAKIINYKLSQLNDLLSLIKDSVRALEE